MLWKIRLVLFFTNFFYMYQHTDFIWLFNIYICIRLKIKPNSVRIRFMRSQIFVLPSTGFELTPLIHCITFAWPYVQRPRPLDHIRSIYIYIHIKSKGIYQPENLMSNGSSRHDDAVNNINYRSLEDCAAIRIKMLQKNILTKFSINKWPSSMSFKITLSL
jgi:hypothetical protein